MLKHFLLLAVCLLLPAGCWSRVEVDKLAIVRCLAVDYLPHAAEPYLVTLSVVRPAPLPGDGGGAVGGAATQVFSGTGTTLDLALQNATLSMPRHTYFTHNEIVLIGEEAARRGLQEIVDLVLRFHQLHLTNFLLLVPGMAHDVLLAEARLEATLPEEILGLLEQDRLSSEGDPLEIYHILRQSVTEGQEAHLAVLRLAPPPEQAVPEIAAEKQPAAGQGGEAGQGAGTGQQAGAAPRPEVLSLDGTAVFRDEKLAGFLTRRETRGYLLLASRLRRGEVSVPDPLVPDKSVSLGILRGKSKITPRLEAGRLSFLVEAELEGDILTQESQTNLSTPEMLERLGAGKADVLKKEMEQTLRRLQELEADIVGFGTVLRRHNPQAFRALAERWPQVFRTLQVEIRVKAHIRRTGLLSRPVPALPQ